MSSQVRRSIESHPVEYWKKEASLPDDLVPTSANQFVEKEKYTFLVSGATGYLGGFTCKDMLMLLNDRVEKIYCLVRSFKSFDETKQMLCEAFKKTTLKPLTEEQLNKIYPVKGDISKERLGLSDQDYQLLSKEVDIIFSIGANVNLSRAYQKSRLTNCYCIPQILKLATSNPNSLKRIIHISTLAVFFDDRELVKNDSDLPLFEKLNGKNGYIQSKAIAELMLKEASTRGFEILLVRSPALFACSETGYGNNLDTLLLCIRSGLIEGKMNDFSYIPYFRVSSVDWLSRVLVKMILDKNIWIDYFNVQNPSNSIYLNDYMQLIAKEFSLPVIPNKDFLELISKSSNPTSKLMSQIFTHFGFKPTIFNFPITENTVTYLKSIGEYEGLNVTKSTIFKFIYKEFFSNSKL